MRNRKRKVGIQLADSSPAADVCIIHNELL